MIKYSQYHDPASKLFYKGTHRTISPSATLENLSPSLSKIGITRVANVTGLDLIGIPVVMVCRPYSRNIAVSQGKGLTLEAAKVSGIMESAENFHAEQVLRDMRLASYAELNISETVVDVKKLPLSKASCYHDQHRILWTSGQDLNTGESVWVPYEIVHTDYTLPLPEGSGCFAANTNGLASGNHPLEAIVHGLAELIERDALTIWRNRSYQNRIATIVDKESVVDPLCLELLDQLDSVGIDVVIWNITSDIGISAFNCLLVGRDIELADPEFGSGCHPDRGVALSRAITEAVQARTTFIVGSRDDYLNELYSQKSRQKRLATCRELVDEGEPVISFKDVPTFYSSTLIEDANWMLSCLSTIGVDQVIAVDLTKSDLNIPVFRIIAPGLEGLDKGPTSDYVAGERLLTILEDDQ